jgi:L-rhamnose isomerase
MTARKKGSSTAPTGQTGEKAKVLVDTGDHYQAQNIEEIVRGCSICGCRSTTGDMRMKI